MSDTEIMTDTDRQRHVQ